MTALSSLMGLKAILDSQFRKPFSPVLQLGLLSHNLHWPGFPRLRDKHSEQMLYLGSAVSGL
jgi:hypothetical protein